MNRIAKRTGLYFWSPTSAEQLLTCPRQWHFNKRYKIVNADMALGSFVHRKIEQFQIARILGKRVFKSAQKWANLTANWILQSRLW